MIIAQPHLNSKQARRTAIVAGVAAAHAGVFALIANSAPPAPADLPIPPVFVELIRPDSPAPPPPPPPPPTEPAERTGGGAPAAPSRIHRPPDPPPEKAELPAPPVQAPEPALTVGTAPIASPTPGMGQGGVGTGTGTGVGAGDGPGRGSVRTPPRNLREASTRDLLPYHPPEALRRRISGTVLIRCRIRPDTRLDQCEVVSERPAGYGFGEAGIRAAMDIYRFRPATIDGVPDDRLRPIMTLRFGPPEEPVG